MKKIGFAAAFLSFVGALASLPASAGTLYTNGPGNDQYNAWIINYGFGVSDSFTLTQASTITGATFDVWDSPGDPILGVDWAIGGMAFSADNGSGTAGTSDQFDFTNGYGYDIYTDTISIPSLTLGAGTYYFSLQNAVTVNGDVAFWDENDGPSLAQDSFAGAIGSETFSITGNAAATPEPSSILLLGSGLAGFAGMIRRKIKA